MAHFEEGFFTPARLSKYKNWPGRVRALAAVFTTLI
jgi:hypothetical protein